MPRPTNVAEIDLRLFPSWHWGIRPFRSQLARLGLVALFSAKDVDHMGFGIVRRVMFFFVQILLAIEFPKKCCFCTFSFLSF